MRYLPIAIDSRKKSILIIGAGKSALIKLKTFLKSEFTITVLADHFLNDFDLLAIKYGNRLSLIKKRIDRDFNDFSFDFIVVSTNDIELNEHLAKRAKTFNIPILNTTNPDGSDFILNKILNRSDISISVSSDAKAPGLSKYLADLLVEFLDDKDFEKIGLLVELRALLKENHSKSIKEEMTRAYDMDKNELRSYIKSFDEN
ncbi:MAG: NAD(P)-dependent oxidoreductase [Tissierellia bacterium]|nr:NAD(P)-dependent oxidoreductase [Tissierellia bacterium]